MLRVERAKEREELLTNKLKRMAFKDHPFSQSFPPEEKIGAGRLSATNRLENSNRYGTLFPAPG